jgi:hypothetical protein
MGLRQTRRLSLWDKIQVKLFTKSRYENLLAVSEDRD